VSREKAVNRFGKNFCNTSFLRDFNNMKRVMILGCCGAGKSTFSKKLGSLTNLEVIHLDQH